MNGLFKIGTYLFKIKAIVSSIVKIILILDTKANVVVSKRELVQAYSS